MKSPLQVGLQGFTHLLKGQLVSIYRGYNPIYNWSGTTLYAHGWLDDFFGRYFNVYCFFMMIQYTLFICETTFTTYNTLMAQWLPESLVSIVLSFGKCNVPRRHFTCCNAKRWFRSTSTRLTSTHSSKSVLSLRRWVLTLVPSTIRRMWMPLLLVVGVGAQRVSQDTHWHEQGVIAIVESLWQPSQGDPHGDVVWENDGGYFQKDLWPLPRFAHGIIETCDLTFE